MNSEQTKALYEYNRWANDRIFNAISKLSPQQYTMDIRSSYGAVRDTMVHIIWAEWIWLMRLEGTSPKALWLPSDFPEVSTLRQRWNEIRRRQLEFICGITGESLNSAITYINTQGECFTYSLWQIILHIVNHSTYHRGQITTMLRQIDAEPVATDFLVFYDMTSGLSE